MKSIVFLILFTGLVHAQVRVKKENGEITISGADCDLLMKQANALNKWKHPLAKDLPPTLCTCKETCSINVTKIVPASVREKDETCSVKSGPNCWNSSLVESGILPYHRFTESSEMKFWMESPLCRERALNEPPEPGDIIAIRNKLGDEVHGFTYLTEQLSYSKNGYYKDTKYGLQSTAEVFKKYDVSDECRRIVVSPGDIPTCPLYGNYFKCEPLDGYFKKHPIKNKAVQETWKTLDDMDCQLSGFAFSNVVTPDQVDLMIISLKVIFHLADEKLAADKISEEDNFMWTAIRLKTFSLIVQAVYLKS